MNTRAQLKKFEHSLDIIRSITRAFEHTATQRMAVNKNEIDRASEHINELRQTYISTKVSIVRKGTAPGAVINSVVRVPTKRKVVLLVSSEPQYYGSLLAHMAGEFITELKSGADGVVIGKPGADEVRKQAKSAKFTSFDFSDDAPDWNVVQTVGSMLLQYAQIIVIFAQFQSILKQGVIKEDLAKNVTLPAAVEAKKYLIKPDAKAALNYLEKQLITGDLVKKLYENGLAKNAVRVKILEIGEIAERLTVAIERFEKFKRKVNRETANRKLINLYSGQSVWGEKSIFTVYR